jgi:hypothetical protein
MIYDHTKDRTADGLSFRPLYAIPVKERAPNISWQNWPDRNSLFVAKRNYKILPISKTAQNYFQKFYNTFTAGQKPKTE